jgi:hypothetical protein
MEYGEPGPSAVSLSQSPTLYRERAGSVAAGQANYESSSSSGVGYNSRNRDRDSPPLIARSSTESSSQHPSRNYPPNVQLIRRDSISDTREGTLEELVPTSFDESAVRVLCEMDVRSMIYASLALAQFGTEWCSMHARSYQTEHGVLQSTHGPTLVSIQAY